MNKSLIKLALLSSLAVVSVNASAEDAYTGAWYVLPGVAGLVHTDSWLDADKTGIGGFLRGGKEISEHWDVQFGASYAEADQNAKIVGLTGKYKQTLLGVDALYMFSRDSFRPFVLAGVGAAYNDVAYSYPNVNIDGGHTSWMANVGVGAQYLFNDSLGLQVDLRQVFSRAEANATIPVSGLSAHDSSTISNTYLNVGGIFRFGAPKPVAIAEPMPEPTPAPAPEPVVAPEPAPAPAPEPVAAPEPCKPTFETITVSAQKLFGFDKAHLKAEGKQELDDAAEKLIANPDLDMVLVTGYTDRIGDAKYNLKLSERRAKQVKDYLVSKGVDAGRLTAVGKGKDDPVVECKGIKGKKLIECLAPNRRVTITSEKQRENACQ